MSDFLANIAAPLQVEVSTTAGDFTVSGAGAGGSSPGLGAWLGNVFRPKFTISYSGNVLGTVAPYGDPDDGPPIALIGTAFAFFAVLGLAAWGIHVASR